MCMCGRGGSAKICSLLWILYPDFVGTCLNKEIPSSAFSLLKFFKSGIGHLFLLTQLCAGVYIVLCFL